MFRQFRWRIPVLLAVCAAVALAGLSIPATAAAPRAEPVTVGIIDLDRIVKEYTGYQQAQTLMKRYIQDRQDIFTKLQHGVGLSVEEFTEYLKLVGTGIDMDAQRIVALQDIAKKNSDELQALQDKADRTADENARFEKLDADAKAVSEKINERAGELQTDISDEYNRYFKILMDERDKTVAKVAETKKLTLVLTKNVQSGNNNGAEQLVLWSKPEADITNDVVKLLNDGYKPSLLEKK